MLFFFSSRRRHTRCALVTGVQTCALPISVGFMFRKGLEPLQRLGPNFLIRKSWALNRQRRPEESVYLVTDGQVVEGGDQLASDFLSLIIFRYIPNRDRKSVV